MLLLALALLLAPTDTPRISADLGNCSADFHVTGADSKPVYNARVHTLIKYGAFSARKTELEVRTDSDGNASVINLPNYSKKPITFDVGTDKSPATTVQFVPDKDCHAKYQIQLK